LGTGEKEGVHQSPLSIAISNSISSQSHINNWKLKTLAAVQKEHFTYTLAVEMFGLTYNSYVV
jgi:hypothetical protein